MMLTLRQTENAKLIVLSLDKYKQNNPFIKAAVLSKSYNESSLIPQTERSYCNTPPDRIRQVYGSFFSKYTDDEINILKKNDSKFWEVVYGFRGGNDVKGDGGKFLGRGFNQITFKPLYKKYGDIIGIDLLSNPNRLNEPAIASECLAIFFNEVITLGFKLGKFSKFKTTDFPNGLTSIDDVNSLEKACMVVVQSNGGLNSKWNSPIMLEGYYASIKYAQYFYDNFCI